ncbi:MAG: hypothetical protein IJW93_04295 [Clostridia bacterium]|nr:hypothetical protein [Clostridia bacterium]
MKKIISLLLCCVILVACTVVMFGCYFNPIYRGQHKELYTVAVYSIPNAVGYMFHGEGAYSSDIHIWEQDDYGRTLFSYCEDYSNRIFALVISQGYDDANVYFYPDANYILTILDSEYLYEGAGEDHLKNRTEDFYLKNKEKLKELNDWNKPLDKTKCVSYQITDHKVIEENTYELNEDQCNEILNDYTETLNFVNPDESPHRTNSILQVDAEGKILHEIHGDHCNYEKLEYKWWLPNASEEFTYYDIILWVITDKDGNYDKENGVMVMFSKANDTNIDFVYNAEDILNFKNKNGWINSYCIEED